MSPLRTILLVGVLSASGVHAQDRPDREAPQGIRAGAFIFEPSISAGSRYDTNVFLEENDPTGTLAVEIAPRVDLSSDWNRHALRLTAGAKVGRFSHDDADNFLDHDFGIAGELDITRNMRLSAGISTLQRHEERGTDDAPVALSGPVEFRLMDAELEGTWLTNAVRVTPFASFRVLNFDDEALLAGASSNQDDRDRREIEAGLEIGHRISRGYEIFLSGSFQDIDYRDGVDDQGVNRDSTGWRVLGGVKLRLARLVEGSVGFGFTSRSYSDAALEDANTFSVDAGLDWSPTRRLRLRLDAAREVEETTIAGASGVVTTNARLAGTYELLRTLNIGASLGFTRNAFEGVAREDNIFEIGLGTEWSPRRGLTLAPGYRFGLRQSSEAGLDYEAHVLSLDTSYRF